MKYLEFNVNSSIKVKLKNEGYQHLADDYNALMRKLSSPERKTIKDLKKHVDKDGYTHFQLWDFMQKFGPTISLGSLQIFETTILIPSDKLTPNP